MPSAIPAAALPWLVADIGGTNARFALSDGRRLDAVRTLACADYPGIADAVRSYLAQAGDARVSHAAIGVATPIQGDQVSLTNHPWTFSIAAVRDELGLAELLVLNDFAALALALPLLPAETLSAVGGGRARPGAPRVVLGPGTGLGVAALVHGADGAAEVVSGEGGHVAFAPRDDDELDLWRHARDCFGGHVSAERLISGPGLERIHAWASARGRGGGPVDAATIVARALDGSDPDCGTALAVFCRLLGGFAADMAVAFGAYGGVYLGGGIVPRLGGYFAASGFRARFEDKGRMSALLASIPVQVIHDPWPGLRGAAEHLRQHLQRHRAAAAR